MNASTHACQVCCHCQSWQTQEGGLVRCEIAQPGFPKVGNRCPGFLYNPRNALDLALALELDAPPLAIRSAEASVTFGTTLARLRK